MGKLTEVVAEAGRELGLPERSGKDTMFGRLDGFPTQISALQDDSAHYVLEVVRYDDAERDAAVREALDQELGTAEAGIKPESVTVEGGMVIHRRDHKGFKGVKAEAVSADLRALLGAVKSGCDQPPVICRLCEKPGPVELVLLNNMVDRICPTCVDAMRAERQQVQDAIDTLPTYYIAATRAALFLAILGGVAWAAVGIATNSMFWLLAIGIGALVGWGTNWAAGKSNRIVQVIAGVATVGSVLLGQVLWFAYYVQQAAIDQGGEVSWFDFALATPQMLIETGGDTLFALVGGVAGAFYSAHITSKPTMPEICVEAQDG